MAEHPLKPDETDPPVPDDREDDSPYAITAYALRFLGLITTCAGALAILRTGERSLFYALFMPVGLVMWGLGFWMDHRGRGDSDE